jgi:hypothetical protein
MISKGIRITDKDDSVVTVELLDILQEIHQGSVFYWSILLLDSSGDLGEGHSIPEFEKEIYDSKNGYFISWKELNELAKKFYQIYDITLIACSNKDLLKRYANDLEMYEKCDIVIEMVDCGYWEVFSKDENLIKRLSLKFKKIEFREPDSKMKENERYL